MVYMYTYFKRQLNIDGSMVSQDKINNLTHTKLFFPKSVKKCTPIPKNISILEAFLNILFLKFIDSSYIYIKCYTKFQI